MSTPTSNKKVKPPSEAFFDELDSFAEASGSKFIIIRGIEGECKNVDESELTTEQVEYHRYGMITKERGVFLELYRKKMILDFQAESHILMYGPFFSAYTVFSEHKCLLHDLKRKSLVQKFNLLFAFTYTILSYDHWLIDIEDGEGVVGQTLKGASQEN